MVARSFHRFRHRELVAGRNSISFRFSGLKVKICCFQQLLSTKSDLLFRMTLRTLFDFTSDNKDALVTLSLSCKLEIVLNNNDDHISIDNFLPNLEATYLFWEKCIRLIQMHYMLLGSIAIVFLFCFFSSFGSNTYNVSPKFIVMQFLLISC